jgi:hypothetical protein
MAKLYVSIALVLGVLALLPAAGRAAHDGT